MSDHPCCPILTSGARDLVARYVFSLDGNLKLIFGSTGYKSNSLTLPRQQVLSSLFPLFAALHDYIPSHDHNGTCPPTPLSTTLAARSTLLHEQL